MNLYVRGQREATVKVKGVTKVILDMCNFSLLQTPSAVTRKILALASTTEMIAAYCEWVKSTLDPYEEAIYDYDAIPDADFNYPIIGKQMVDPAQEHITEFLAWISFCNDEDYTVIFTTV